MNKPELIAPAGDFEKLKIAFQYGADAVYASTPQFSMRTRDIGFDLKSLLEGINYTHEIGKKIYLTLNIYPHPGEVEKLKEHAIKLIKLKPDAFIVADPGIITFLKGNSDIPIHLSTQANATNQLAIDFWLRQGAERVVLARELSLKEISLISQRSTASNMPLAIEAFVHGSMCMAYSGRCQISNYLAGRDPNRGACVQACRFNYKLREYSLEEESRPGEEFPIFEDKRGTHFFNSKDLCMIEHIDDLLSAGVSSFKIEGRLKSIYYVGAVTRAYRQAIDIYFEDPAIYEQKKDELKEELRKVSNRLYTTGFYYHKPTTETNNYESSKPASRWGYVGLVSDYDAASKRLRVEGKNRIMIGDIAEIVTPKNVYPFTIAEIYKDNSLIDVAHADYKIEIPSEQPVPANSFLRVRQAQPAPLRTL